eukprot:gnl/TRDRNA2_/TRDRNA2_180450_c0_seq1.p1 gnl/TRDRNA2_/TRDRNA2_180450_c0~~gnl/TRDRNA2_/TRDRNA2_180450_c0_seq1.p1  ORF type:complete len:214 (+),score=60.09 gnl/TRDRNA2_/TRDRNA2_180450_c0_seq1:77-643(+)
MADKQALDIILESDLLLWKSKVKSGAVLIGLDVMLCVYFFFDINLIVLLSNIAFFCFFLGALFKMAGGQPKAELEVVSKDSIAQNTKAVLELLNKMTAVTQQVFLWQDKGNTVKALAGIYIIGLLSMWMNFSLVAFLVGNLLFIVPVQLKAQEKLIQEKIQPELNKLIKKKDELFAKIPKYTDVVPKE